MKSHKTEAIVLHTHPSRERDKLVVFMTPELGKLRGWAYGARSLKSRFGSTLEPLTKVQFGFFEKEGEETVRIESASMIRSMFSAQQDLRTSFTLTYFAETVDTFAQPAEALPLVYRLLDRCCEALLEGTDPLRVAAYFEVWMLRLAGIFPSVQHCMECHGPLALPLHFDETAAGFVCAACDLRSQTVPNDVTAVLQQIVREPVGGFAKTDFALESLHEARRIARHVRRHFLGHELKSYDVLQGVM